MPVAQPEPTHGLAPAEQYLRALWDGRWLFLLIVAVFAGGSLIVTALLPRSYSSEVILSVRPAPQLEPAAMLYSAAVVGLPTLKGDDPGDQGPRRYVRRLTANGVVTAAARDAGVVGAADTVDERDIAKWISVQDVEKTDLLLVSVSQPTADVARKFALALVTRVTEEAKSEATASSTRDFLNAQLRQASTAVDAAEAVVVQRSEGRGAQHEVSLERAKLELTLAREQYATVRKRLGLLDLIVANQQFQLTVVDAPTLPLRPAFPRPVLNLSIGLILGILGATTVIVLRSVFARR